MKATKNIEYQWHTAEACGSNSYVWKRLLPLLPTKPSLILDVGCGNGFLTAKIAELGHTVIGIDSSSAGIELAVRAYPKVTFFCKSAYDDLSEVTSAVDYVVSSEVIEHLMQPKLYLQNIHAALKPGGTFFITTPYHGYLKNLAISLVNGWDRHFTVDWDGGHVKFFSKKTLENMLSQSGFTQFSFLPVGRCWGFWKSAVILCRKPL